MSVTYNASPPLLAHMNSIGVIFSEDEDKIILKHRNGSYEGIFKNYNSRKDCKCALAIIYANANDINISNYRKVIHNNETKTPLELLEILKNQFPNSSYDVKVETSKDKVFGIFTINNVNLTAEFRLSKDHKYCKQKVAKELLLKLRGCDYSDISKASTLLIEKFLPGMSDIFIKGQILQFHEDKWVEFKGGKDENKSVSIAAVENSKSVYGKAICGMLNSYEGGKIYVGVHENSSLATVDGLQQGFVICPADQRFLLLFTFLRKNKNKKIMV